LKKTASSTLANVTVPFMQTASASSDGGNKKHKQAFGGKMS
jgi:hypothetical protein